MFNQLYRVSVLIVAGIFVVSYHLVFVCVCVCDWSLFLGVVVSSVGCSGVDAIPLF